jgi:metal-responsive CopG/Arc/MetJ family transcriptional regulator
MVVARRQVLVQLDDERLALLDERAARSGQSRSALVRAAVDAYLDADAEARIDAQVVAGYEARPQEANRWAEVAARETIAAEPW